VDLLDLRPCPAGRFVVPEGLAGIIPNSRQKSREISHEEHREEYLRYLGIPFTSLGFEKQGF
jgi:hypothetical protein